MIMTTFFTNTFSIDNFRHKKSRHSVCAWIFPGCSYVLLKCDERNPLPPTDISAAEPIRPGDFWSPDPLVADLVVGHLIHPLLLNEYIFILARSVPITHDSVNSFHIESFKRMRSYYGCIRTAHDGFVSPIFPITSSVPLPFPSHKIINASHFSTNVVLRLIPAR